MKKIYVTQPSLPDRKTFDAYVDRIFESRQLTNNGPLLKEFTQRLEDFLGIKHIVPVANGTLALQIAYKLLELKGDVITTPFTFIATASSLAWEGLSVRFVDIDPETFNLDPSRIEESITDKTSAILPVHVFGNPCEVEQIQQIAEKYQLKVIYDASHAFGIQYKNRSVLEWGDISTLSFHATKLFHTIEGGALIIKDDELADRAMKMINFGFTGQESIECLGINAKMNEFQAAMGLSLLGLHEENLLQRKKLFGVYDNYLADVVGYQQWNESGNRNYGYYPVLFENETFALEVKTALVREDIFARRYFNPSLDTLGFLRSENISKEISRDISSRILCLPLYASLEAAEATNIAEFITKTANK